jgi:undecaprenyl-diphosphatase
MLDIFNQIDIQILLFLNGQYHPVIDAVMISLTKTMTWVPLYAYFVFLIYKKYTKSTWKYLVLISLIIIASDQISSSLLKPIVKRLRPCHQSEIAPKLHVPNGCGGQYGFVSSHAANTFAAATFLTLVLNPVFGLVVLIFLWATIVSYTRIYLGVHFPFDILGGAVIGIFSAYLITNIFNKINNMLTKNT